MIVSTSHKFVFIGIPKTGSTSARVMLSKYHDMKQNDHLKLRQHTKLPEILQIDPNISHYKSCCFVRNTWDRLLSAYLQLMRNPRWYPHLPLYREWLLSLDQQNIHKHILTTPQHVFINDTTRVFRFENYQQQIREMYEYLQIETPDTILDMNKSNTWYKDLRKPQLDPQTIEHVGNLYATDNEQFNFEYITP